MSDKKIIAVVGATGAQGGGLVRAILADENSEFAVRAITRNINSDKAKALAEQGCDVVSADTGNKDSLVKAFEGAYGAFCITQFWEHFSGDREHQEAKNLAEAAKEAGVQHAIWSTLEDTREFLPIEDGRMPVLQEKYNVPHFDAKGAANKYFTNAGVPVTLLNTCFYWENLIYFGMGPQRGEDGVLGITFPMGEARLPGIAAGDIGNVAYAIFKAGDKYIGKTVGIAGEHLTGSEMAAALTAVVGEEVRYNAVPADMFRSFGFDGADEMGNMFQFKADFEDQFVGSRPLDKVRELHPGLMTFKDWLGKYGKQIPVS